MSIVGEIGIFAFGGKSESDPRVLKLRSQGWVACEGQSVDQRGPHGLPDLFAAIERSWGSVDHDNVFNLPDLRGQFLRGWDHKVGHDPDSSNREASKHGGDAGDAVGSAQPDQLKSHNHGLRGPFPADQNNGANDRETPTISPPLGLVGDSGGGAETRPKNVYVMFCIYSGSHALPAAIKFFG
ncbi:MULTISPECIES: phage tail protein [unclassified Bradyrhizobium]|uniref:phage tail protein n=1 Tax=unclassified Bradyrhizobium TaxID=2631580 RepID=UPI002916DD83|nr:MULTISPECIES: phage tail protein [unclassified Bradyrhizobium]